jgi:hypothetical protein
MFCLLFEDKGFYLETYMHDNTILTFAGEYSQNHLNLVEPPISGHRSSTS